MDGVRTAFGRAGAGGAFWRTRADDMAVKVVRELLRRNPALPPERIDDVVFAATAQVGDQGLTLGRDVALLAGPPELVPGFAVDRMCAGALTATTAGAGEIAMGAADVVLVGGVEHMGHHPMGEDVDFNPRFVSERLIDESRGGDGADRGEPPRRLPAPDEGGRGRVRGRVAAPRGDGVGRGRHGRDRRSDVGLHRRRLDGRRRATSSCGRTRRWRRSRSSGRRSGPAGRVTAGNSAGLTDGATAALLASEEAAAELGLEPRMRLVGFAYAGVEPELMGLGPVPATQQGARAGGLWRSTTSASSS